MVNREDFLVNSNGISISCSMFSMDPNYDRPVLLLCHGMPAGDNRQGDVSTEFSGQELDYPAIAEWFALEGFNTIIFNFRGTGESGGNFHPLGWVQDLNSLIDFVNSRRDLKAENIAIFGSSLGAAISIYVASRRQDVGAVVSFASPATMLARKNPQDAIQRFRDIGIIRDDSFPDSIDQWASESEELSPDKSIENISPRPILLIHGTSDEVVPTESAHILYSMAGKPKKIKILENVGHRLRSEPEALMCAIDWLKTVFVSNPLV